MSRFRQLKTWELLAVAGAGVNLGAALMYIAFVYSAGPGRVVAGSLVALGQLLAIAAVFRWSAMRARGSERDSQ